MTELRLEELSAATIVAVNTMSLKPGQEQYLAPTSYAVAGTVANPSTAWQRVVLDGDEVVGFVSANFDPDARRALPLRALAHQRRRRRPGPRRRPLRRGAAARRGPHPRHGSRPRDLRGGQGGPDAFFRRVGFTPVGETEFGEVVAEVRL
jgi:diamine N-acetyltransferase